MSRLCLQRQVTNKYSTAATVARTEGGCGCNLLRADLFWVLRLHIKAENINLQHEVFQGKACGAANRFTLCQCG